MAKWKVEATYLEETYQFTLKDEVWWLWLLHGVGGITLSKRTIRLKRKIGDALRRNPDIIGHEAVHVYQARKLGWKYLPTYIIQAIKAGFKKDNIVMEHEAYNDEHNVDWKLI